MNRHDYQTKCYRGETSVRDFKVCETFHLTGHPEIDSDPPEQRSFVITGMQVVAQNNLPKGVAQKVERLFDQHRWTRLPGMRGGDGVDADMDGTQVRFCSVISAVRIGVPIVPAYDEWADLPSVPMQSAIVVGPPGEEVHCDELGRVKIRFPGMRAVDHEHAHGAGASGTDADSAWVRVTSSWAGNGPGAQRQCGFIALPPVGSEVAVAFMGGDPDKPVIVGQLYNADGRPPALSDRGDLPGNRHLSGMKSRENKGSRHNQLRFDDSNGRINAQLASDHGTSQLNLGYLTQPLANGYGEDRGEGAELRSDKAVVLRGGHGVLVSAAGSQGARGKQLDRAEMIGLNDVLHSIYKTLCDLANTHLAGKADGEPLAKLIEHIRQWEGAQADGGKQVVAVSAPAGIAIASQANVAIGARTNVDVTSAGNIQMSTGRELLMRAAQGLSLFSHRLGMQLIAAAGKMSMQTHQDNMELTAAKQLVLTAKDEIILQAPKVTILTQGAQASYGGGAVTYQLTGAYTIKSASFAHRKPGDGSPAAINLPTSATSHDQRVCIRDLNTGRPKAHQRYRVTLEDGKAIEGTSDAKGMTEVLKSSIPFGRYKIEALDD